MMFPIGTKVRSTFYGKEGTVVGYGALQWPEDPLKRVAGDSKTVAVYLVKDPRWCGSSSLGQACFVLRAQNTEEVK